MRRFDPMRNEDGSVCIFRVSCLSIVALCMLIYASMTLLGCAGSSADDISSKQEASADAVHSEPSEERTADFTGDRRQIAQKTLNEAVAFYRDCGSINQGFEGCVFDFSKNVTTYYDVSANAADDGFAVILKAKDDSDPKCTFFEADSNGILSAFDARGNKSDECLK